MNPAFQKLLQNITLDFVFRNPYILQINSVNKVNFNLIHGHISVLCFYPS